MDDFTNYKLVLMIVSFGETYNSDLMNVQAQNMIFLREIYNEEYVDCQNEIVEQLKAQ